MRLPYKKRITSLTSESLEAYLSPLFGGRAGNDGYFIGFGIGDGWTNIVFDLHKKLMKENPDYYIAQVKEKFAGLRYYVGPMTDQGHEYIREAEELSLQTCEECGRPGKLRTNNHWLRTLCDYDSVVASVNKHLWNIHRGGLSFFFRHYFAVRRFNRKRKGSAKDDV
jgi:hypothetical protein